MTFMDVKSGINLILHRFWIRFSVTCDTKKKSMSLFVDSNKKVTQAESGKNLFVRCHTNIEGAKI